MATGFPGSFTDPSSELSVVTCSHLKRRASRPFPIQAAVDRDSVQPGGQRGISPEIADAPIGLQKNLLNDILTLFSVERDPEGDGKNLFTKTTDQ